MARSSPATRSLQRQRRRARRILLRLCLHGLTCPLPIGPDPAPPAKPHRECPLHRTRAGRRPAKIDRAPTE